MIEDFARLVQRAVALGRKRIAICAADDQEAIGAVRDAAALGLADAILVGDRQAIMDAAGPGGLPPSASIVDVPDRQAAALEAVRLVRSGMADFLMKGAINTSDFLKAVLDKDVGLRSGSLLSHMAAFEIPGERKLVFYSDGGMNVAPELEEKRQILANALEALRRLGIEQPKVAVLAANEQVNPKVRATTDAAALAADWKAGVFRSCIVEGPIAFDVATSAEAAKRKGLESSIAGDADLFIMPSIEAGNIAGKLLLRYAGAKMAGLVLGALCPIVLVSRADDAAAKVNSLALACLVSAREG
ncbi:MAG: phosphate acyltransferase [Spirochaetaceae bacterium]|nr:phosphate acyltransferase [Spirochaetaceae bacterium]